MSVVVWSYLSYLGICLGVTIWVAHAIQKHGRVLVNDDQQENHEIYDALTHLLIVGFYLVNLGAICMLLRYGSKPTDMESTFEVLSTKIGGILLVLGFMLFVTIAKLSTVRTREQNLKDMREHRELLHQERLADKKL